MKRTVLRTVIGEDQERIRVRIETDECVPESQAAHFFVFELLRHLAEQPDLSACGMVPFQKLSIFHDGKRWIAEAEAVDKITPKG